MPLQTLPVDVLLDIFQHLHVYDILSLRQTCRGLAAATRERTVWHDALTRHAWHSRLPIPNLDAYEHLDITARELETMTLRALGFWSNWLSPHPKAHQHLSILPSRPLTPACAARNLAAIFLPDFPKHILILTLYDDVAHQRRYAFELWDISDYSKPALLLDEHPMQALLGYAVNTIRGSSCTMTISRRDPQTQECVTEAYSIEPSKLLGSCFRLVNQFPGYRNTIGLHGSHLIATDAEQDVRIIDVNTGRLEFTLKAPIVLNDATLRLVERQCMDALIVDNYILTFCKQYVILYQLPPPDTTNAAREASQLEAVATHKWRWRIDTLVAKPRLEPSSPALRHPSARARPTHNNVPSAPLIDLLIRFDTWFPWPVNVLHHFVLEPNTAYRQPPASTSGDPGPNARPYPYVLSAEDGPAMAHSIPSPLRIFTPADATLSAYGTALWIDAAADSTAAGQAGDRGQRVAGRVLTRTGLFGVEGGVGVRGEDDAVSPGMIVEHVDEDEAVGEEAGEEGAEGEVDVVGTRGVAVGADPAVRSGTAVSVFHVREDEEKWNRVAVDEESGRIAVGQVDGTVTVYSYVPCWK
ncbi:hypothetical protein C2E23DRAFT_876722 [Lenzites betulinus]|nr:hypothetical protein C2E23DRAFT_876722 [Lenzites betulinus]